MSIVENIQKLFKTKSTQPVDSMDMASVGMPPESMSDLVANDPSQAGAAIRQRDVEARALEKEFVSGQMANAEDGAQAESADLLTLPLLGRRTITQHQRILLVMLALAMIVLGTVTFSALNQSGKVAQQLEATGQSLMQSQRLAKSVSQALVGSPSAFPDVRESAGVLAKAVRGLKSGEASLGLAPVNDNLQPDVETVVPLVDRAEKNAKTVMDQEAILTQVGSALRTINRQSSDLLEIAETVSSLKLQQNSSPTEISASGQLVMLTQRIGKSANEFLTMEGVSPEAVFLLGKDLNSFKEIAQGLLDGSPELRLSGSSDAQTRERLAALIALYEETRTQASAILGNLQGLVSAREAQSLIIADSEPLRRGLEGLQEKLSANSGVGTAALTTLVLAAALALLCAAGLARLQLQDSRQRQEVSENQRQEAKSQEQDAKRV
ncbi:MAG: type IV pili methyl-accepting chemotaxis transducer N-terminal domain-containing protein, partial [Rhodoferax sp.]|nr:type IV pili methyl-accepting chemotaxis transducer N-terminal domain-containing protein [Rhodoferax sp.]